LGVELNDEEIWEFVTSAPVGVLVTLRRDGVPIALPIWFAAVERKVYVSTPVNSKKVARLRRDARASFLVEQGERWAELKAVHLTGRMVELPDSEERERALAAIGEKYAGLRTPPELLPDATVRHYAQLRAVYRLDHEARIISWDNLKIRPRSQAPPMSATETA
jgi:nitroimidazol reductase NimA-like FMN-containing flavoprotein (pyridoxamine 5'-phosphate oxidase superfamily)